ncbi:hypothetical protein ABT390_35905 [Streptomyces aurantiacus]|uniref:hypothetical protein n=1 Tax=Streptomyces aurantiacus TaxID=47760 RepID=UPI000997391B|nr:hypothetical protein [Streptomyces aurantiacus]
MSADETSRFVRLRVELVVEVDGSEELRGTALSRIAEDAHMPDDERAHAQTAVKEDDAEALAYLVDPVDLIGDVPGVELTQASWSSEVIDYDPDSPDWDPDEDDDAEDDDEGVEERADEGDEVGVRP